MTTARTAVGPDIIDRIKAIEAVQREFLALAKRLIVRGALTAYDAPTHTATVTVDGVAYAGIPVAYEIMPYAARAGVNAQAIAGVAAFNAVTPSVGCVIYITSATVPPNPLDALLGHKHRGITDDAPTL